MNDFGKLFKVNIFGTSHGSSFGVLIDGVPAGIKLDIDDFKKDLERRIPKESFETSRKEIDTPIIEAGLFNGYTNGTPLLIRFSNDNQSSKDYSEFVNHPRPGHADYVATIKYNGFNDYRGGGAFSGRLTAAIVAAGVVAKKIACFKYQTEITKVGGLDNIDNIKSYLDSIKVKGDSIGGVVTIKVNDVPACLGEPFFYSCESAISQMLFSIGGVKGVSFGDGFDGVDLKGSEFNDLIIDEFGHTKTNHSGGINGGITNGNELVVKAFIKPISSILIPQKTYNFKDKKVEELVAKGRHDSSILSRVQVVLEAGVAIALADLILLRKAN